MKLFLSITLGLFLATPVAANTVPCGDVTGDGKVTASDALAILNAAVGLPVDLQCQNTGPVFDTGKPECEAFVQEVQECVPAIGANLSSVCAYDNPWQLDDGFWGCLRDCNLSCNKKAALACGGEATSCAENCLDFQDDGEVECPDGTDIYTEYVCDGYEDCSDGWDEYDCTYTFECIDGQVLSSDQVCDGSYDCDIGDDTDERNCPDMDTCPGYYWD